MLAGLLVLALWRILQSLIQKEKDHVLSQEWASYNSGHDFGGWNYIILGLVATVPFLLLGDSSIRNEAFPYFCAFITALVCVGMIRMLEAARQIGRNDPG